MKDNQITAAIAVIGDEILSGRTQDKNINFIASQLFEIGVELKEVRVISDEEQAIIDTVQGLSKQYNYVFTTGGIGPTHDDITAASIAKAFNTELVFNQQAYDDIVEYLKKLGRDPNAGTEIMALIPKNARLLKNSVSAAPGFAIENVFVMAGIPNIMQDMFMNLKGELKTSKKFISKEITAFIGESHIATIMREVQAEFLDISVGSYPSSNDGAWQVGVVIKGQNDKMIDQALKKVKNHLLSRDIKFEEEK